ncbi:MAG: leucine-rich repeat protein, partial [Hominimerdicola sp.]
MKSKKIIAGVLSFSMVMTSLATPLGENASDLFKHLIISSEAATEDTTEDISPLKSFDDMQVGYSYKGEDRTYSFQFTYNDGMFISDADEESSDLAKVSVSLAMSAYNEETIHSCLENMGFSYTSYNYSRTATYDDNDFVAYTIANKQVTYNGEEYNVFIVPIRGTSGNCEWFSNFNMGTGSNHTGFYTAANEVMTSITNELAAASSNYDKDHTIVLTTGHSRGAAVANIVAGKLSCTSTYRQYVTRNHIFGYNFACPAVSKNANTTITNIRNYNNSGDVISALPLSDWGFRRFGVDCELDMSDDVFENFEQRFKSITGEDYAGLPENDSWVSTLKLLADSQESYNTNKNRFIFGLVAAKLASSTKSDFFEYAQRVAEDYPLLSEKVMINILMPELWKFTTAVNATQDLVLMSTDSYKDLNNLLIKIDNALSDTAGMDSDEFKSWLNSNSSLISSIKNKTDIEVASRSNLVSARNDISDQMQSLSRLGSDIETLFNLFYQADGIGNLGSAIFHAHTGETYILWINSMFYGYNGWANNKLIKKVTIPDGIIRIDKSCFYNCIALEEVTIPDTVLELEQKSFADCKVLTKVTMPVDLDYIQNSSNYDAFTGCTNVEEIRYTVGRTNEMTDFVNYSGDNQLYWTNSLQYIAKNKLTTVSFDEGITHIGNYAFRGCSALSTVNLPSTLKSIGKEAFNHCTELTQIEFPVGLETLGEFSFYGCSGLATLNFTQNITEIPEGCFEACTALTDLTIPVTIAKLNKRSFKDCTGLTKVTMPVDLDYIQNSSN